MRNFAYTVLIAICIISLSGCFGGGGSGGSGLNPMAPEIATAPIPEAPVDANIATGTATVVIRIVLSERASERQALTSIRASAQAPYVQAQLYVDDKLFYSKTAAVVNGAIEIAFSNVVNSGLARVELNFVGCHLHGATKFSGQSQISQQTVISVKPIWPEGAIVTSDGRLLREVFSGSGGWPLIFDAAGNPISTVKDGYYTNLVTGQKYFRPSDMVDNSNGFYPAATALHNGVFYMGGKEYVYTTYGDPADKKLWLGQIGKVGMVQDGTKLADAALETVRGVVSQNGVLYIHNSYQQILEVQGDTLKAYTIDVWADRISITDDNRKFFVGCGGGPDNTWQTIEALGTNSWRRIGQPDTRPSNSVINYGDGNLIIAHPDKMYLVDSANNQTVWLTVPGTIYTDAHAKIFKSPIGKIYVTSDRLGKIWEVL